MEVKKFTNKKKTFLEPKFKQSEKISIAEQFQNKPFKSNDNEVRTTLISVDCLKFSCSFFEFSHLFMLIYVVYEIVRFETLVKLQQHL